MAGHLQRAALPGRSRLRFHAARSRGSVPGNLRPGLELDPALPRRFRRNTWLYRVALNSALAWSRQERKHRDRTEPLGEHEATLRETSRTQDGRLGWLYEQIALLDHVDRLLTLLLLDGLSYREMAETLGISESYVGVKINRSKNHLKSLTKERQHHEV